MSVDRLDFARTVQASQHGQLQNHWPIIIDPTTMGITQLGQEMEVNISPCDGIFLPTFYDPSLGLNPGQATQPVQPESVLPFQGPNAVNDPNNYGATVGMNVFDVWDSSAQLQAGANAPAFAQVSALFSLKFNNANAPWMLWGLSSMLSEDAIIAGGSNFPTPWPYLYGGGDAMRSITGPITRMWVKYLRWANALFYGGNSYQIDPSLWPTVQQMSRIVLISSLNMNHQISGGRQDLYDSTVANVGPTHSVSISNGGYVTPQLNSYEQEKLKGK